MNEWNFKGSEYVDMSIMKNISSFLILIKII